MVTSSILIFCVANVFIYCRITFKKNIEYIADGFPRVLLVPNIPHSIVPPAVRSQCADVFVPLRLRLQALQPPAHPELRQKGEGHVPRRRSVLLVLQLAGEEAQEPHAGVQVHRAAGGTVDALCGMWKPQLRSGTGGPVAARRSCGRRETPAEVP